MRQDWESGTHWVPFRPHEEAQRRTAAPGSPRAAAGVAAAGEGLHDLPSTSELEARGALPEEIYDLAIDAFGLFRFDDAQRLFVHAARVAEREIDSTTNRVRVARLEALQLDARINVVAAQTWRRDLGDPSMVTRLQGALRLLINEELAREQLVQGNAPTEVFAAITLPDERKQLVMRRAARQLPCRWDAPSPLTGTSTSLRV